MLQRGCYSGIAMTGGFEEIARHRFFAPRSLAERRVYYAEPNAFDWSLSIDRAVIPLPVDLADTQADHVIRLGGTFNRAGFDVAGSVVVPDQGAPGTPTVYRRCRIDTTARRRCADRACVFADEAAQG